MSNKKWRTPAGESQKTAADSATAQHAPPETSTTASGHKAPARLRRLPDDYLENGHEGDWPEPAPGVYRTAIGAGEDLRDMRVSIAGTARGADAEELLSDDRVEFILRDALQFLWQVVSLTARVAETIQVGDLRQIVAAEMAMPGDVVKTDGTISRYPDAAKKGAAEMGSGSRRVPDPISGDAEAEPGPRRTSKARGASHPFMMLLRLAVQASRLIKQITAGTHPEVHNKLKREPRSPYGDITRVDRQLSAMLKET